MHHVSSAAVAVVAAVAATLAVSAAPAGATTVDHLAAARQATKATSGLPAGLSSVSAVSGSNVWAAGDSLSPSGVEEALTEQYTGSGWEQVPSPDLTGRNGTLRSALTGVDAVSAKNVWAVGWRQKGTRQVTLIEHWDGTSWTVTTSPSISGATSSTLLGISGDSATDIWAVGDATKVSSGTQITSTLIEHWDGTSWTQVTSPSPSSATDELNSVSADSPTDAWAVGDTQPSGAASQTLIEHWDGTSWTQVTSPDPGGALGNTLHGVSALSSTEVWAVGSYVQAGTGDFEQILAYYNGHQWTQETAPSGYFEAISVHSKTDAWAVGESVGVGDDQPLTEQETGVGWAIFSSPGLGTTSNALSGIDVISADNAWAVGQWQSGSSSGPLIVHWNGQEWSQS